MKQLKTIMNYGRYNWQVVVYGKKNNVIDQWKVKNRTEHEAEHEANADLPSNMDDWTMTKCN